MRNKEDDIDKGRLFNKLGALEKLFDKLLTSLNKIVAAFDLTEFSFAATN